MDRPLPAPPPGSTRSTVHASAGRAAGGGIRAAGAAPPGFPGGLALHSTVAHPAFPAPHLLHDPVPCLRPPARQGCQPQQPQKPHRCRGGEMAGHHGCCAFSSRNRPRTCRCRPGHCWQCGRSGRRARARRPFQRFPSPPVRHLPPLRSWAGQRGSVGSARSGQGLWGRARSAAMEGEPGGTAPIDHGPGTLLP